MIAAHQRVGHFDIGIEAFLPKLRRKSALRSEPRSAKRLGHSNRGVEKAAARAEHAIFPPKSRTLPGPVAPFGVHFGGPVSDAYRGDRYNIMGSVQFRVTTEFSK